MKTVNRRLDRFTRKKQEKNSLTKYNITDIISVKRETFLFRKDKYRLEFNKGGKLPRWK